MITAYASTSASPNSSDDLIIDLSGAGTIPQSPNLFGSAVDSANPAATFSFSWALLDKPTGSSAAVSSAVVQNPTLNSVDTWGTYRLFLIATNTATNEQSETDPVLAPESAFCLVRIKSTRVAIEKPAKGQRNWQSHTNKWADVIEAGADVVVATPVWSGGVQGGTLTFAGTAGEIEITGAKPNVTIGIPTQATLGNVTADSLGSKAGIVLNTQGAVPGGGQTSVTVNIPTGSSSLHYDHAQSRWEIDNDKIITVGDVENAGENTTGTILTRERLIFSQVVDGNHSASGSTFTAADGIGAYSSSNEGLQPVILFKNHWSQKIFIEAWSVVVGHGGSVGNKTNYSFELITAANLAAVTTNTWTAYNPAVTLTAAQDHIYGPAGAEATLASAQEVAGGAYFAVRVTAEPQELGRNLYCTIQAYREIG